MASTQLYFVFNVILKNVTLVAAKEVREIHRAGGAEQGRYLGKKSSSKAWTTFKCSFGFLPSSQELLPPRLTMVTNISPYVSDTH